MGASNVPSGADGLDGGMGEAGKDDDDVPDLVENFDEASKNETTVEAVTEAVEKVTEAVEKVEITEARVEEKVEEVKEDEGLAKAEAKAEDDEDSDEFGFCEDAGVEPLV